MYIAFLVDSLPLYDLNQASQYPLALASDVKFAFQLIEGPLYVISHFSLAALFTSSFPRSFNN